MTLCRPFYVFLSLLCKIVSSTVSHPVGKDVQHILSYVLYLYEGSLLLFHFSIEYLTKKCFVFLP